MDEEIGSEKRCPTRGRSLRLLVLFWLGAGFNHFASRKAYEAIVPPPLQSRKREVVMWSGVAEIVGGLLIVPRRTRRLGGLWILGVLAAVFPANLHMARSPEQFKKIPRWALLARLPLQPLMMIWAWRATRS